MGEIIPGNSSFLFNTTDLPNGVYIFRLRLQGEKSIDTYAYKVVISRR